MREFSSLVPLKPADFYVLLVLTDGPLHGYGIMKAVEEESSGEGKAGDWFHTGLLRTGSWPMASWNWARAMAGGTTMP